MHIMYNLSSQNIVRIIIIITIFYSL